MIKNLKEAKKLVEKYKEILSDPFELEDIEDSDGDEYSKYGQWLKEQTGFNGSDCILCKPLTTFDAKTKVDCGSCIWSMVWNEEGDFQPVEVQKWNIERDCYCVNDNFDSVSCSKTWFRFEQHLSKRVEKLESLIKEVEKDELQNK